MMDFSLHLPTSFTFIRQNKAIARARTHAHSVYKTCTGHPLALYLNSTVDLRGWKVYWKQSMHIIHIYIYPGPWSRQMLHNRLAALPCGYDHSGVEHEVPTLPVLQPSSASQQLSVWLALGCGRWWGKLMRECSCLSRAVSICTHATRGGLDGIRSNVSKDRVGGHTSLSSRRHSAGQVWSNSMTPAFWQMEARLSLPRWDEKLRQLPRLQVILQRVLKEEEKEKQNH